MSRRGEKKIMEIPWEGSGIELKVPVWAVTETEYATGERVMRFRARCEEPHIDIVNTDINKLKLAVVKALDEWYSIDWELYLMVEVSGNGYHHEGPSSKIEIEVEYYVVGKDVRGNIRHMEIPEVEDISAWDPKNPGRWSGRSPKDGWPDTGEIGRTGHYDDRKMTTSLVKATPENVAALKKFMEAMNDLRDRMHHHFAPARVEKLLAGAVNLLPAPKLKG